MATDRETTVAQGLRMTVRHPSQAAALLAKTLGDVVEAEPWIDEHIKKRFCLLFLSNLVDGELEKSVARSSLDKLLRKPMAIGIRLLKRKPDEGIRTLVVLVTRELRDYQGMATMEQLDFYNAIFAAFFPATERLSAVSIPSPDA